MKRAASRGLIAGTLAVAVTGLAGCSDNGSDMPAAERDVLQMLPFTSTMCDITRATIGDVTVPDNYVSYSTLYPQADEQYATIGVFLMPDEASTIGSFIYQGNDVWDSHVTVEVGKTYYLYGFMPREMAQTATIAAAAGGYANGATLSIDDMQVVVASDPSVVVGVQDVPATVSGDVITPQAGEVKLGTFSYTGKQRGTNFVRLLLDHLYAGINFCFQVDNTYSELRSIRLRQVVFKSNSYATVDCAVTLQANTTNTTPLGSSGVTFTGLQTGTSTATVYSTDPLGASETLATAKGLIPSVAAATAVGGEPLSVLGCFVPSVTDVGTSLSLITTYDVYDKTGNLVREGVSAENRLPAIPTLSRGQVYTLTVSVIPTYLYQLSDPDLDNPTIKISNP